MPFGDGTGPAGKGPRTGRGAGNCAGKGDAGRFGGRGAGMGRGGCRRGFGLGRGLGYSPDQERSWLEAALQNITERLDALKDK